MPDTTDPLPSRLDGYDASGRRRGIAALVGAGCWVIVRGPNSDSRSYRPTEQEARDLLRRWGAVEIRESGGRE